jgi:hypothetical protein
VSQRDQLRQQMARAILESIKSQIEATAFSVFNGVSPAAPRFAHVQP